jgi:hypothetical protein
MCPGKLRAAALAISLAAASLALVACGSSGDGSEAPPKPAIPTATANRLASLSDRVASDLDDGELCTAAGEADDLLDAVQEANLPPSFSSGVEASAQSLVNEVNCPPPPKPEPKKHKKDEKKKEHDEGDEGALPLPNPSGHVPPGQAKLKGESGL